MFLNLRNFSEWIRMEKVKIIYTPNADDFRLGDADLFGEKYIKDSAVEKLRRNCAILRKRIPSVPFKIGIVTFPYLMKQWCREKVHNLKNPTTNYVPLDLLRRVLDFKNEDSENPLTREYVYRATSLLFSHTAIGLDDSLRFRKEILGSTCTLSAKKSKENLNDVAKKIKEKFGDGETYQLVMRIQRLIDEIYPSFKGLEQVYNEIKEKFEANNVSADFPLYYLPGGSTVPFIFSVSLEESIERDPIIDKTLEYIAEGCKVMGLKEIPKDTRWQIERLQKDRFGKTEMVESLDNLLEVLPYPKTIITDIYIADHFPSLKDLDLETQEFRK